jgi:hypothetical protein
MYLAYLYPQSIPEGFAGEWIKISSADLKTGADEEFGKLTRRDANFKDASTIGWPHRLQHCRETVAV